MKVHELVARFARAAESKDAMNAVRDVLEDLARDVGSVEHALAYVSGIGGNARQVFYRAPDLTLLKVCFPKGRRTPPHDHGTWATILLLSGEEKNTLYRREDGTLRRAGERTLRSGAILAMREETVHVAECLSEAPAIGLHVYGGDIFERSRRMWNPETLEEHALDWTLYERFAQAASRASGAPAGA
jgi:predicted metal-dependent enzyme (double-stranded beta helix superfamily)